MENIQKELDALKSRIKQLKIDTSIQHFDDELSIDEFEIFSDNILNLPYLDPNQYGRLISDRNDMTYSCFVWETGDSDYYIPPHKHKNSDELIFIISGQLCYNEDNKICGPGDFFIVPKSISHSFTISKDSKFLVIFLPAVKLLEVDKNG